MTPSKNAAATETLEVIIPAATALIPKEEAGLPGIPEELQGFTGLEDLDASTVMIIPRIKIVQPTSKEGNEGMLRVNLTGDEFSEIPIVVVKAFQGRTFWDPDPAVEKVLCRSYDFLKPDSGIEKPFSEACAQHIQNIKKQKVLMPVCEQAKWHGIDKPHCAETYNLLCIQAEDFLPFWLTLAGASIKPVRNYISAIVLRRCALWQWQTILSTEKKTEPKKHYIAKFGTPKPMEKALQDQITRSILELNLQNVDIRKTFEAEEAQDANGAGGNDESPGTPPEAPGWVNK